MSTEPSITDVVAYIQQQADEHDIDSVLAAVKTRRKLLQDQEAAAVKEGSAVELRGLRPKYLNGLAGTVARIESNGARRIATVTLDATSTQRLASVPKYNSLFGQDSYDFWGIPLTALRLRHTANRRAPVQPT